jgi:DNA-binding SARP family transcriptional activator
MPTWSVRLFGAEELRFHQRYVGHLPDIFWPIFGCLLAAPRRQLSRTRIAGLLWPERDETAARHCLATALWRVRSKLPEPQDLLIIDEESVGLRLTACWIDCAALEQRAGEAVADPGLLARADRRERLTRALALYRGGFMPDRQVEWLAIERERYRTIFLDALHLLASAEMDAGRFDRAREAARRLCEVEPLREDAQRLLMTAHARCGNRGLALAQFRTLQLLLQQELGIDAMPETRQLAGQIGAGQVAAATTSTLALRELAGAPDRALLLTARDYLSRSLELINQTIGE